MLYLILKYKLKQCRRKVPSYRLISLIALFVLFFQAGKGSEVINYNKHTTWLNLESKNITAITKDIDGFIWITTRKELVRFNGTSYQRINTNINNQLFSNNNFIQQLYFRNPDQLWICSNNGLFIYNIQTHELAQIDELATIRINSLRMESERCYLNTSHGIIAYDINLNTTFPVFTYEPEHKLVEYTSLTLDSYGRCYLSANKHLLRLPTLKEMEEAVKSNKQFVPDTLFSFKNNSRVKIDQWDNIWIWDRENLIQGHIDGEGNVTTVMQSEIEISALLFTDSLSIFCSRGKENVVLIRNERGDVKEKKTFSINQRYDDLSNTTNVFFLDEIKNIWIGSRDGLFMIPYGEKKFFTFRNDINNPNTLSHTNVCDIRIEQRNTAWIATSHGLNKITFAGDAKKEYRVERFFDNRPHINRVLDNKIEQIEIDSDKMIWLGTKGLLKIFDPKKNIYYTTPEMERAFKRCSFVRALYADKEDDMWVGFENGGIFHCDHITKKITRISLIDSTKMICLSITGDYRGTVWAGTSSHGILQINRQPGTDTFTTKQYFIRDKLTREIKSANSVYCDNYNNIWAGSNNGLYKYSHETDEFINIPLDLLNNQNHITGLISDNIGNLWISTLTGICRYNISERTEQFIVLNGGNFAREGFVFGSDIDSDGFIYLSGINGLTIFNPEEIASDTTHYNVLFTDFRVNNRLLMSDNFLNHNDINYTPEITLKHNNNQIYFAFSALVYTNRENIRYAYMLQGVDPDWMYVGPEERYISYANLHAGNYTLKIKSTNGNGIWQNNTHTLRIRVNPPFWRTWYSYLFYIYMLGAIILFIVKFLRLRMRLKAKIELDENRQKIYTDLAHSIKTPLTLLQSSLQSLSENSDTMPDDEKKYMLSTMSRNSNRISLLVNQIGELRKVTQKKPTLQLTETDFIVFAYGIYENFKDLFESKEIEFMFSSNVEHVKLIFDSEKIEITLLNLLSNAYKFTPRGGMVQFICTLDSASNTLQVEINDTGSGIKREYQENVFERFVTVPNSESHRNGIGLGLTLAKEYVELHYGKINLTSSESGTQIKFYLHLGNSHFKDQEIGELYQNNDKYTHIDAYVESELLNVNIDEYYLENAPLAYLVENDLQTIKFIEKVFSPHIRVKPISNHNKLFEEVLNEKPRLIISEVVFEGDKTGFDLCRKIKENPLMNVIPFVFITAYSGDDDKKRGYEQGADAYISKPFDVNNLKKRMMQLIQNKDNIVQKSKQELIVNPRDIQFKSAEDRFLTRAMEIIENNLDNEKFNVMTFATEMNLSSSMLYRKIKGLTNLSPNELIRSIRLKRAAQMLKNRAYTVSEVALKVGFIDIRYFSSSFKKEFGVPPSVYSQSLDGKKND